MLGIIQCAERLQWSWGIKWERVKFSGAIRPWHGSVLMLLYIYYSCNICLKDTLFMKQVKAIYWEFEMRRGWRKSVASQCKYFSVVVLDGGTEGLQCCVLGIIFLGKILNCFYSVWAPKTVNNPDIGFYCIWWFFLLSFLLLCISYRHYSTNIWPSVDGGSSVSAKVKQPHFQASYQEE